MNKYLSFVDNLRFDKYKDIYCFISFLLFVVILSFLTIYTFHPHDIFILGDDTSFHIKRFHSIYQSLFNGSYPFYIDSDALNGYGYATNLFYPDYFLLPFALLIPLFGVVKSYKLMLCIFFIVCALISYISTNKIFKKQYLAIFFSLLYTFSLYHIIQFSYRNTLGEFIAYSFVPLVFWGFYEIVCGDFKKKWIILGIGFSCIILSHLLSVLIVGFVLIILLLINLKSFIAEPKRLLYLIGSAVLCVLLTLCFTLPMLEQMSSNTFYYETNPFVKDIADRAISIRQLITGMLKGVWMKYIYKSDIGITLILPLLLRVFIKRKSNLIKFADISCFIGLLCMLCTTVIFPWGSFPFNKLSLLQFPWRLMGISSLFLAFSSSVYIYSFFFKSKQILSLKFIFLIVGFAIFIMINGRFFQENRYDLMHAHNIDWINYEMGGGYEYIPSNTPSLEFIQERGNITIQTNAESKIQNIERKQSRFYFDIQTNQETEAILPLLHYKGYKATLNGKDLEIIQNDDGLVQIKIASSGKVVVWFDGTLVYKLSFYISIITMAIIVAYFTIYKLVIEI